MSALSLAPLSLLRTLTPEQKTGLFQKLEAVQAVNAARYGTKGDVVKAAARDLRVSTQAVNKWVGDFNAHGAEALVDGRRKRGKERGLPEITQRWITEEYLRLQREDSGVEIYKLIRDRARLWGKTGNPKYAIPGLVEPPAMGAKGYPVGLSQETIRRYGPDAYQRALAHQGRKAASDLLPSIPDSRIGVSYLERIFFDDQVYDHMIQQPGWEKPMRPVGFNALDYLTGAFLDFHMRLRWWDENSESHRSLTQREFVWFVLGLLSSVGYRGDAKGTRLVFEHGTANSWSSESGRLKTHAGHASFESALSAFTGGKVTIDRSGKFNQATWSEMMFVPKSAGNFRFKAPIESMFRAVRTHGLLIPGATGRNADLMPAENYGLEREETKWLKLASKFPTHIAEAVQSNLFSFAEYYSAYRMIYAGINADPDHALKDWEALGFVMREWRWEQDPTGLWRPRAELARLAESAPHVAATFDLQRAENPGLVRTRRMSRAEAVRQSEMDPAIRTLDIHDFHNLLPLEWAHELKVTRERTLVVRDPLIKGTKALTYFTACRNERGHRISLSPGDQVLCHLNPFAPDSLIVLDQHGAPIGIAARIPDDVASNADLAQDLLAARALQTADADAPVRAAFQGVAERRREVKAHNEGLRDAAAGIVRQTPAEKASDTKRRNRVQQTASSVDTSGALDAWASSSRTGEPPAPAAEPKPADDFNPFA
ncbi:helix-turn-helix domain-containing protein [Luteolibacter flavescens]|uniref:Helix-turn-helix domain-containing protein n=1 Tax=Luteolibacter flavescens TaxID=1859460 RepID=A0ABT3FL62_9BACT|nr:helix-turn-helix domain-containing protein [Luteolibacter flavescens]MCW1883986.1 helix-turn-helix domain-containing protein [Luteolibacter flavescens]